MNDDDLPEQARKATIAAREAQEQVDDEWSVYQSLVRTRMQVGHRVQQALGKGDKDIQAHKEYAALLPQIEAQRRVFYEPFRTAYHAGVPTIRPWWRCG
jgi:hypothetical protein